MILSNQRGYALLTSVGVISVVVLLGLTVMQKTTGLASKIGKKNLTDELEYYSKKSLGLGAFLVANNLVLCKESNWLDNKKCRWGGDFHNPKVQRSDFSLSSVNRNDDSFELKVNFNDLPYGFSESLIFNVVKFNNKAGKDIFGDIPEEIRSVDADYLIVTIRSKIYNSQSGFSFERENGIRRPLGRLRLSAQSKGACNMTCVASIGQNPNPSCRGPQEIPEESVTQLSIKATNEGPGAIYAIHLTKERTYDSRYYTKPKETSSIDLMKNSPVIMPGQSVLLSDTVGCIRPTYVTQTVIGPAPSSSVHSEPVSTVEYFFDLEKYGENLRNEGDGGGQGTGSGSENEHAGYFEPPRLLKKVDEVDLKYNITKDVVTNYVQVVSHAH